MFKVEYKYSACIKIITDSFCLLCDPWLSAPAYDGTWSQYPPFSDLSLVGDFDYIYISHIHPDHYSPDTLKNLFSLYGEKPIFISDWGDRPNYLSRKISSDGFGHLLTVCNEFTLGSYGLRIIPNKTDSISAIDSSLILYSLTSRKAILNFNDCIFSDAFADCLLSIRDQLDIEFTLFCLGYTGGALTLRLITPPHSSVIFCARSLEKKSAFISRYQRAISAIPSRYRLPFAGKYILNGEFSILNQFRGVADALEIKSVDPYAIVLDDDGSSFFDLETVTAHGERKTSYPLSPPVTDFSDFSWRKCLSFTPSKSLLTRLLKQSLYRAHKKSECDSNCHWSICLYDHPSDLNSIWSSLSPWLDFPPLYSFNCNRNTSFDDLSQNPLVHSYMFIESKALFCVLTGITHWNNYEIGSVFQVRRQPDHHVPSMQSYLNFLSVV